MSKLNSALTEVATKASWKLAIRHDYDDGASKIDYSQCHSDKNKQAYACLFVWLLIFLFPQKQRRSNVTNVFCFFCFVIVVVFCLSCLLWWGYHYRSGLWNPNTYILTIQLIHHPSSFAYGPIHVYICMYMCVFVCIWIYIYLGGARPSATFTSVRYIASSLPPLINHPKPPLSCHKQNKNASGKQGRFAHSLPEYNKDVTPEVHTGWKSEYDEIIVKSNL